MLAVSVHFSSNLSTRRAEASRLPTLAGAALVLLAACRSPSSFCDADPQPTIPTLRLAVLNIANQSLDSISRVARIDASGALSEFVGLGSLARIDPEGLGGRSEMRLAVTATGYLRRDVLMPRDCDSAAPKLIQVVLTASP